MNIVVNEDLQAYIDPLTPAEHQALERSLLSEGCRDALVLWGELLVDGHNRYGICRKHNIPFQTLQSAQFKNMDDVHLWMIDQHLGRRSVSDFQRGVLALRKREILAERRSNAVPPEPSHGPALEDIAETGSDSPTLPEALKSRKDIARAARLSNNQVMMIEKIQNQAAPELVAAVRSGSISLSAAASVATLSEPEQVAAVLAGKDELRQAAKRVRETRKHVKPEHGQETSKDAMSVLQARVVELEAENAALRAQLLALQR